MLSIAYADDRPPGISEISVGVLELYQGAITIVTDEPTSAVIHYGTDSGNLNLTAHDSDFEANHQIALSGLTRFTDYFFSVEVADAVGNSTSDDNSGNFYTFKTRGWPNLIVTQASIPQDTWVGQQIVVSWTVSNTGEDESFDSWWDRIYLSSDDQIGGDQHLGQLANPQSLNVDESYATSKTVTIPSVAAGDYWIVITIDGGRHQQETNEDDNSVILGPMSIGRSNLIASLGQIPASAGTGEEIQVGWRVTNSGDYPTNSAWEDGVYLSGDDQVGDDTFLGSFTRPVDLGGGEFYDRQGNVVIPGVAAGTYWIVVLADRTDQIRETDEDDNAIVMGPITIARPNLTASNVTAPASAWTATDILVDWSVTNLGSVSALGSWVDGVYISGDNVIGGDTLLGTIS